MILLEMKKNSVFFSSHIVSDLEKICDYIVFIHKGKLLLFEEKDLLLEKYGLLKITNEEYKTLPEDAILGVKKNSYNVIVLVEKSKVIKDYKFEHTNLEDIILFSTRRD